MEEQQEVNAPVGTGIRAGVGIGARVVQNVQRSLMEYALPSLLFRRIVD